MTLKSGLNFRFGQFRATGQFSYTASQFTDATNAVQTSTAVEGIVPAYHILDLSASYTWRWLQLETGNHRPRVHSHHIDGDTKVF